MVDELGLVPVSARLPSSMLLAVVVSTEGGEVRVEAESELVEPLDERIRGGSSMGGEGGLGGKGIEVMLGVSEPSMVGDVGLVESLSGETLSRVERRVRWMSSLNP
jgi:hypothetical protein